MTVRLADIIDESIVDGPGTRIVVFVQGCIRDCKGCHNPELQLIDGGIEVTEERLVLLILNCLTPLHRGVTFTGGDPLIQPISLLEVIKKLKRRAPHLNVWVYTGYSYETVHHLQVMEYIDVLVDGPFIQSLRDISLKFRGSSNQRLIDVQRTREAGEVVLWQEPEWEGV